MKFPALLPQLLISILFLAGSTRLSGQDVSGHARLLLPVVVESVGVPLPGANGSSWMTTVSLTNRSATTVKVTGALFDCRILCEPAIYINPNETLAPWWIPKSEHNPGAFLFVEPGRVQDVAAQLRVHDLSRRLETWGTTVPVVREDDLFLDRIDLIDIPASAGFRTMLRIYDFEATPGSSVRVRIYAYAGRNGDDFVVFDRQLDFVGAEKGFTAPGFIQLPLPPFDDLGTARNLRIEITSTSAGLRFWAFASVVHNETQHLTVITPAR